ncbi:HAD-IA family hydrolase [Streptomyces shenzhenensis]|uniref:HAD-IA family hydrolase n=1 Tax=Streptomyces shenzhenensis TaxID=943815 RepID=UPI0033E52CEB
MSARALVLDCDGVLAETERDGHLVAFNRAFEQVGLPFRWGTQEYGPMLRIGGGKERLGAYLADHPEFDLGDGAAIDALVAEVHARKTAVYVALIDSGDIPARPGVARLIGEALDAGWQVACASTSAPSSVEAVLRTVIGEEQRSRIAGVFAGDVVPAKKPAPDIYLLALDRLGRQPTDVLVVEDSQSGAAAAAAAGLAHLVTVSHYTAEDAFPAAGAVVSDLGDPGLPRVELRAGVDPRNADGFVDLEGIERVVGA